MPVLKQLVQRARLERPARAILERIQPERRRDRLDNEHLRLLLAFLLRSDSNCIDVGCNRGEILKHIVSYAPDGDHFAFEPIPALSEDLRRRFPTVHVRQLALSSEEGKAQYTHVLDADGYSGLHDRGLAADHQLSHFEVQTVRLDDILPEGYTPDFIKIDVEGAQRQVMEGGLSTLRAYKPTLWLEHGHLQAEHYGTTSDDVWDLLCGEIGYRIFDADGVGPYTRQAFSGLDGVSMWSFVAH